MYALADATDNILFAWGFGDTAQAREDSATAKATSFFGVAPTITQNAEDSPLNFTNGVPAGKNVTDYEVVTGVIQEVA
jgi:hypothetical protein